MNQYFVERIACPGCGHDSSREVLSSSFSNPLLADSIGRNFSVTGIDVESLLREVSYRLRECERCGLNFQQNCFSEEFMSELYQKRSLSAEVQARDATRPLHKSAYYAHEIVTLIKLLKRNPADIDVLDYGMGWGHWCFMAKAYGCNAYGYDISERKREFARENGIAAIDALGERQFDYINTEQVLEHVLYPLETVKQLFGALKPGGILKISVPNGDNLDRANLLSPGAVDGNFYLASPMMHINTFTHDSILAMAAGGGLAPVTIPISCQYSNLHLLTVSQGVKALLRPLYRRFRRTTYLHFTRPAAAAEAA